MFTYIHNFITRRKFKKETLSLYREHFGLSNDVVRLDNHTWKKWIHSMNLDESSLLAILTDTTVENADRGRALVLLLTPKIEWTPFVWKKEPYFKNYTCQLSEFDFSKLDRTLKSFLFKILPLYMKAMESIVEEDPDFEDTAYLYRSLVILALSELDEEDPLAAKIFELWQPLDPVPHYSPYEASGYNDVYKMFCSKIPFSWKWKTHERMKEIIMSELSGKTKPREKHEGAHDNYLSIVERGLWSTGGFPYDKLLFAEQVDFLIGEGYTAGGRNFKPYHSLKILKLLKGDKHLELRRRFARYLTLRESNDWPFSPKDKEQLAAAKIMLAEAEPGDTELRAKLQELLDKGQAYLEKKEAENKAVNDDFDFKK